MISIRTKIILSLIALSIFAIAVTALSARSIIQSRFETSVIDRVGGNFLDNIKKYYLEYGSWEKATESETFHNFRLRNAPRPLVDSLPTGPLVRSAEQADGNSLIRVDIDPVSHRFRVLGLPPLFLVADKDGKVVIEIEGGAERVGDTLSAERLQYSFPIMIENKRIGYALSDRLIALAQIESSYLSEMENTWWLELLILAALAIPLGFLIGGQIAAPIDGLNKAIKAMQPNSILQHVPVKSRDEIGRLSRSFNRMSEELSSAYKELEVSRSRLREYGQEMKELSLQDPLTLLPNRRAFNDGASLVLAQANRHKRASALALIDIDYFKRVNDEHSHEMGDKVLIRMAEIMRSHMREGDLIARHGGEEFVALFPETDLQEGVALTERLRVLVEAYNWAELDSNIQLTISIGVVEITASSSKNKLKKALKEADKKLYEAKANGRNRVEH